MKRGLILLMLLAAAAAAGCAAAPVRFGNPMAFSSADPQALETVAKRVLMELGFEVELPQAREGYLTTGPVTGASWFEFWRPDTLGAYQVCESSIHTTRRRVAVTVLPKGGGAEVLVKVTKQRMSAPGISAQSIGEEISLFEPRDRDLERKNELAEKTYQWIDMGRDDALEQRILERIQLRLSSGRRS